MMDEFRLVIKNGSSPYKMEEQLPSQVTPHLISAQEASWVDVSDLADFLWRATVDGTRDGDTPVQGSIRA